MKYKLLVIFLFAIVLVLIIYNRTYKDVTKILSIGSNLSYGKTPFNKQGKSYDYYLKQYMKEDFIYMNYIKEEENILEELQSLIKYNKEYIIKGKKVTINHLISKSDYIIIDLNDNNSITNCNSRNPLLYINKQLVKIDSLTKKINKIYNGKIILLGYYCKEKKLNIEYVFDENIIYLNLNSLLNSKYYYLPSSEYLYPSLDGYNSIANQILKQIKE